MHRGEMVLTTMPHKTRTFWSVVWTEHLILCSIGIDVIEIVELVQSVGARKNEQCLVMKNVIMASQSYLSAKDRTEKSCLPQGARRNICFSPDSLSWDKNESHHYVFQQLCSSFRHPPSTQVTETPPASESLNRTKNVPGCVWDSSCCASFLSMKPSISL